MSLLQAVVASLREAGVDFALIGAAALASHRVARATGDLDLLAVSSDALLPVTWNRLRADGCEVEIRVGDHEDPLAGVVRIARGTAPPVDLVVGNRAWQRRAIERAEPRELEGTTVPVVRASDLILLKLFAAGPQDRWDVARLLEAATDRAALAAAVEADLPELGEHAARVWQEVARA